MPMGGPLSLWEKPSCKKLRGPMGGTKSKPNAVDSIWNGGARERQNECAMSFAIEMKKLVASDMSLATSCVLLPKKMHPGKPCGPMDSRFCAICIFAFLRFF